MSTITWFVLSDDHSRVQLERDNIDYINASLVQCEEANRKYILTQVVSLYPCCVEVDFVTRYCTTLHVILHVLWE